MEVLNSSNITKHVTSAVKLQDEVHPSIRGDLVTHQIGDNVKRVHNEFHGFPDDIQEAERGRLHGDSIKSQLGTFIHPPTENRDNSVFKIREFV